MLSQIENGAARPSMDTLRYLANRLGKPMGYFLEEQAVTSPNQEIMEQARHARGLEVLTILKEYQSPDPVFDRERWLLEALACLESAREALTQGKPGYCGTLLERCAQAGAQTPYYTQALETERLLLSYEAGAISAEKLWDALPQDPHDLLLRCQAAQQLGKWAQAEGFLLASENRTPQWHLLMGRCYMAQQNYQQAAQHLLQAEHLEAPQLYADLETCYRELEDYKQAYFYACKQKK